MSAHWIYDPNGYDWCLGAWKCSKCGTVNNNIRGSKDINPLIFRGSKFCPECGEPMTEKTTETTEK